MIILVFRCILLRKVWMFQSKVVMVKGRNHFIIQLMHNVKYV